MDLVLKDAGAGHMGRGQRGAWLSPWGDGTQRWAGEAAVMVKVAEMS